MSLVAFDGTPLVAVGHAGVTLNTNMPSNSGGVLDATLEACHMLGQIFTSDGGSHTIDTTGSSSLGYKTGNVTFANAGSTFTVGLAAFDTGTGPPGRATNVVDLITFSVSKVYTGGGGAPTANAWQAVAPSTGTLTIANGDYVAFCAQMVVRAGADSIITQTGGVAAGPTLPQVTNFLAAAYSIGTSVPNAVITFSDGALGFFFGGSVFATSTTSQVWNNGSATVEYGNYLLMPFPTKVYGITVNCNFAGNTDLVLYSAPLGTPVAEKTVSVALNTIGSSNIGRFGAFLFSSPYTTTASQPLAAIIKPTSATNVTAPYTTLSASAHQASFTCGTNGYAVNRASGAFAAQNSSKDRFGIGLLVGAFDDGASAGGGMLVHPGMSGRCSA